MRVFLIVKFFAMFVTICTSGVTKKYEGGLEESLKENREVGQSETEALSNSFKYPPKKLERVIRGFEAIAEGAPFYPGSPGDQKYPEDVPDCKNCVWSAQPGRVGEGARLRLDFSNPSSNCSCPNFRGSAEILAGPWRMPPEPPVVVGRDWSPQTTSRDLETTTKVTKKPAGFFKGIQDFFKHSFHMDKTTPSLQFTTTTPAPGISSSGVAKSNIFQLQPSSAFLNRPHEDPGKGNKASSFLSETEQLSRGREATFNLRIKAVALPRRTGTKMVLRSLKRKPQRATGISRNGETRKKYECE